jgi:hypothetical protein
MTIASTLSFALVLSSFASTAHAQKDRGVRIGNSDTQTIRRLALVIGNGAYTNAPPLKNPPNDAADMAEALTKLGFTVEHGVNLTQRQMKAMIRAFGQILKRGGQGLFYFAGHGVQLRGRNYLIPVDADIQGETDVEDQGVDANLVLGVMDEAENGLNVVILDACRNNPFARSFRSVSNGLAQMDAPTGTLVAYATAPGKVANDGAGRNGAYTAELLKQMQVQGLGIEELFKRVRANVKQRTNGTQVPWESSSLIGDFYLNETAATKNAANGPTNALAATSEAEELTYWDSIKNSSNVEDFRGYLREYPKGRFATEARTRVTSIERARSGFSGQTKLLFTGKEDYESGGSPWTRYRLSVENRSEFPDEMFQAAPDLPPCGRNANSSRSWIDIYDGNDERLYGFCAINSVDGLGDLWFARRRGEAPPDFVYIVIIDRKSNKKYKSNLVSLMMP